MFVSGQHPYLNPSYNGGDGGGGPQDRAAHQAALAAARTLGESQVSELLNAQSSLRAQQETALRLEAQAAHFRDAQLQQIRVAGANAAAQPSRTPRLYPQPPKPPTAEEYRAQQRLAAERARNDAFAREFSRQCAKRRKIRRAIKNVCGLVLLVGFLPAFTSLFGAGSDSRVFGVLYIGVIIAFIMIDDF